jgi:hypothetical protein
MTVVAIEKFDNVVYLDFLHVDGVTPGPPPGISSGEEASSARRGIPIRWSPRPVRVAVRRFAAPVVVASWPAPTR